MLPTIPPSSCKRLPHGLYSLGLSLMAILGWCFSLFQDGCDYARVSGPILQQLASSKFVPWLEFGMGAFREPVLENDGSFQSSMKTSCILSPAEFIDGAWRSAQIFSLLALMIGGAATLFLSFSTCFVFRRDTWRWIGYELLVASLFQTITFCWFATDICSWNICEMYWGSIADILACTCWYVAGIGIIYKFPEPGQHPVESISVQMNTTKKEERQYPRLDEEHLRKLQNKEHFEDEPPTEYTLEAIIRGASSSPTTAPSKMAVEPSLAATASSTAQTSSQSSSPMDAPMTKETRDTLVLAACTSEEEKIQEGHQGDPKRCLDLEDGNGNTDQATENPTKSNQPELPQTTSLSDAQDETEHQDAPMSCSQSSEEQSQAQQEMPGVKLDDAEDCTSASLDDGMESWSDDCCSSDGGDSDSESESSASAGVCSDSDFEDEPGGAYEEN